MRQIAEKSPNPLDRLAKSLEAVGVRDSDIVLAEGTKTGAGDRRDPGLVEQLGLQGFCVVAGAGHVGKGIERAAGIGAAYARQRVERLYHHLAALGKGAHHALDRLAWSLQRRDHGELRRRVDAGMAVYCPPLGMCKKIL